MLLKQVKHLAVMFLIWVSIAGCAVHPNMEPTAVPSLMIPTITTTKSTASPSHPADFDLSEYSFPTAVDPARSYLFYLHGKIVEDQGIPAVSPEFGEYQYQAILEKLTSFDFVVISEQREKDADVTKYAQRIREQVNSLIDAGVPARNITVVGASKGALIAADASHLLENKEVRFVLLSVCNPESLADFEARQTFLYGQVLSIYDVADVEYAGSCDPLFKLSEANGGLTRHDEIVLHVGTGHGILYKPLDEWILPVVQWARDP